MLVQREAHLDVTVIGGGTAGHVAAIQSARAGASTALLELGSQLGGTMTTGGVNFPGLFHAWGKQVISGIGWELVEQCVKLDGGTFPNFPVVPERHSHHQVLINPQLYAALAEEACVEAGVEVHYYELPVSVEPTSDGWTIQAYGPGLSRVIHTKELIDATGDAGVVDLAGGQRERSEVCQPGTIRLGFTNYDRDSLDADDVQRRYEEALADGSLQPGDTQHPESPFIHFLKGGAGNNHVFGADSSTSELRTKTNLMGRQAALRILRFLQSIPGCEEARLSKMQTETAVRETYRIVADTTITVDDYRAGKVYDDAVCYAFYPVDLHDDQGVKPEPLAHGVVPTVPFSALTPRGLDRILAAGRCLGSDQLANSALRVQAICMAMGQACGAAAALAAQQGIPSRSVRIEEVRALLRKHGAIVP